MMMGGEDEDLPSIQERNPLCADCSAEGEQYKRNALSNKSALERRIGGRGGVGKAVGVWFFPHLVWLLVYRPCLGGVEFGCRAVPSLLQRAPNPWPLCVPAEVISRYQRLFFLV